MMFGWLFGVILILIVVWYFSQGNRRLLPDNRGRKDPAREVLDKRYAKGEITREEYEDQKRTLGN